MTSSSSAPRYDRRLLAAIRRLDDESLPVAEVCRRVGAFAESCGLARPSYVHVRRIVKSERARRRETEALRNDVVGTLAVGLVPDPVAVLTRRADIVAGDVHRPGRRAHPRAGRDPRG